MQRCVEVEVTDGANRPSSAFFARTRRRVTTWSLINPNQLLWDENSVEQNNIAGYWVGSCYSLSSDASHRLCLRYCKLTHHGSKHKTNETLVLQHFSTWWNIRCFDQEF